MDALADVDISARWALVASHRARLLRIARRRLPTLADAEDCVQEAMLRAVAAPDLDPNRVGALLTTITIRLCIDWQRRARVATTAIAAYGARRDVAHDPIDEIDDIAEARWLHGRVALLPDTERAVLLARVDGHSTSEAARRLGLSYQAAERAFTRARRKMRLAVSGIAVRGVTIIVLPWRRRTGHAVMVAPVALVTVLVTTAVLPYAGPAPADAASPVAEPVRPAIVVPAKVVVGPPALRSTPPRPAPPRRQHPPANRHRPTRDTSGDVEVGPVKAKDVDPTKWKRSPTDHVSDCMHNGVELDTSGSAWGVLCRDGDGRPGQR